MTKPKQVILLLGLFMGLLLAVPPLEAGWVWTKETGWYNPERAVTSSPEELLEQADKAFAAKRYRDAARGYYLLLRVYPASTEAGHAHGQLLEAQFLSKNFNGALITIQDILARRPDAETISHVVKREYEIGAAYLTGTPRYFLGIAISAEKYGVEILTKMVERYPYQPFSDDALFHIASFYYRKVEFLKAEAVYQRLIRDYPQSEWAGIAEYQIGESALKRLKGVEYDFAPLEEAERRFSRYMRLHSRGDKAKQAQAGLDTIDRLRADRLLRTAIFYIREKKPRAARMYLQQILRHHPNSLVEGRARELLKSTAARGG
ncbi:MAG: outer membrane protein assembly factor BamD [Planctomycetota bacterium]